MTDRELISSVTHVVNSLLSYQNTDYDEAFDASYTAFENCYKKYLEGKVRNVKYFKHYLYRSARNQLITNRERDRYDSQEYEEPTLEPSQLSDLIHAEQVDMIYEVIYSLEDDHRQLALYMIKHPGESQKVTAKKFGVSHANLRIRKYRMSQALKRELLECIRSQRIYLPEYLIS